METKSNKPMTGTLCAVATFIMTFIAMSCISNADDEEQPTPPIDGLVEVTDSSGVIIDSSFVATTGYLLGEWRSEYEGYDSQQSAIQGKDVISRIQRVVLFTEDGHYESHVRGIANIADTIYRFKEFEHEYGTCSFDEQRQVMKYTVAYDSLINFTSGDLEFHAGKVRAMAELKDYEERMWFSVEKEGLRDWIRVDDNLRSASNHAADLFYIMKNGQ